MKQKTRYNVRLAQKKDVTIEISDDIHLFYDIMVETGNRDEFGIHSFAYYQTVYDLFKKTNNVVLLIAKYKGIALAGLMMFISGDRAWYFYGASNNNERNRMPTYLLQFEAMLIAKQRGCKTYDLWGIPDEPEEVLENEFQNRSDGLWGVYRFKRGFGGQHKRSFGARDIVLNPLLYRVFRVIEKSRSL
jgi:lipid II:glycine glycyltransferase (peptidoglycan interpeptide bridge formation enzyme)